MLEKNRLLVFLLIYLSVCQIAFGQDDKDTIIRAPVAPSVKKYDRLKKTIAIINFSSSSPSIGADIGKGITDMLITALVKSGQFIVIEREKLDKIVTEQLIKGKDMAAGKPERITELEKPEHMVVTGMITPKIAIEIGKMLYADIIITGRIINFGLVDVSGKKDFFIVGLQSHLISSQTGHTLAVCEAHARSREEIDVRDIKKIDFQSEAFIKTLIGEATRETVNVLVSKITNEMVSYPWEGNVIELVKDNVYISGGKNVGLCLNDKLVVLKEIERNEDRGTGAIIKKKFQLIGEMEVCELEEAYAVCNIIKKGKGFEKGNIVQLKDEYETDKEEQYIAPEGGITLEEQWEKVNKLRDELEKELSSKPKGQIELGTGGIYLTPYKELSPKAQDLFNQLEKENFILIKLSSNDAKAYGTLAWLYQSVNLYDKAIAMMEKAIIMNPKELMFREGLSYFYMQLLKDYDPLSSCGIDTVEGVSLLTIIYHRTDKYTEQESISESIREKQGITKSDIERWRWEYIRNAETYLELAGNAINPEERKNTIMLIVHLSNINAWKNYDRSIVILSNMANIVNDDALIWNALGTAYGVKSLCEKKKEYMDKAEECLKMAVKLKPQSYWFHKHLAEIYSLKGGYYTGGAESCTIYILNNDEVGLGYEPSFLYPDPVEKEKYKALAIEEIDIFKKLEG